MKPAIIKTNIDLNTLLKNCKAESKIIVKAYTAKELSVFYEIPTRSFAKWLSPIQDLIGIKRGHWYTVQQVEIIFSNLGVPHVITAGE